MIVSRRVKNLNQTLYFLNTSTTKSIFLSFRIKPSSQCRNKDDMSRKRYNIQVDEIRFTIYFFKRNSEVKGLARKFCE